MSERRGRPAHRAPQERAGPRPGRLLARPLAEPLSRPGAAVAPGLQPLGLDVRRDGLLCVPAGHAADRTAPLMRGRRIVPRLQRAGYDIRYHEFDGPHAVPPEISREALTWFLRSAG